jgi:hypothetical protein
MKKSTVITPVAAPAVDAPLYALNEKAQAMAELVVGTPTLQTPAKGLGKAWRAAGHTAPNTRVAALAAILAGTDGQFTAEKAQAVLTAEKAQGLNLGTGTPRSYVAAFIKNGYFTPAI